MPPIIGGISFWNMFEFLFQLSGKLKECLKRGNPLPIADCRFTTLLRCSYYLRFGLFNKNGLF